MPVFRIKPQKLSLDAFAKYGTAIIRPEDETSTVCEDRYTFWPSVAKFDCPADQVNIGISRLYMRPFRTCVLERQLGSQVLTFPLTGSILLILSLNKSMDKEEIVDYKNAEAFIIEQGQGVVINKGVWHWTANPIGGDQDVMFCTPAKGVDDGVVKQTFPRGETLEVVME